MTTARTKEHAAINSALIRAWLEMHVEEELSATLKIITQFADALQVLREIPRLNADLVSI